MLVMTYSQARQNFSSLLDSAKENGCAMIKRADGSKFLVEPVEKTLQKNSPFAALAEYSSTVNSKLKSISMREIIDMMHETQDERADQILAAALGKKAENFFDVLKKK